MVRGLRGGSKTGREHQKALTSSSWLVDVARILKEKMTLRSGQWLGNCLGTACVTVEGPLNFSTTQWPHLQNEDNNSASFKVARSKCIKPVSCDVLGTQSTQMTARIREQHCQFHSQWHDLASFRPSIASNVWSTIKSTTTPGQGARDEHC